MPTHGGDLEVLPWPPSLGMVKGPAKGRSGDGCEVTFLPGLLMERGSPGVWHQLPASPLRWHQNTPCDVVKPFPTRGKPPCSPKGWELEQWGHIPNQSQRNPPWKWQQGVSRGQG